MSFQYPAHPNTGRTDPFAGPDGKNPFADSDAPSQPASGSPHTVPAGDGAAGDASARSQPASDSPYAVPAGDGGISYQPSYEAVCPHRGRTVFWLGISGCVCVVAAAMSAGALLAIPNTVTTLAGAFCPLLIIAALTLGGTAWMLGRHDLHAIRSGAMDPAGTRTTRQGHRLGVVGVLISVGVTATFVVSLGLR